jgi:hypothetical protein
MTDDFNSQFKDGVKYFIWMCVLTIIVGVAVALILMPHEVAPAAQATPTHAVASAVSADSIGALG